MRILLTPRSPAKEQGMCLLAVVRIMMYVLIFCPCSIIFLQTNQMG